jgi:hypothetical protein
MIIITTALFKLNLINTGQIYNFLICQAVRSWLGFDNKFVNLFNPFNPPSQPIFYQADKFLGEVQIVILTSSLYWIGL